jgi:hypothetical protein
MRQEDIRSSNIKLLEEVASTLGDYDIKRLEAFAEFLRKHDKSRVLELDLWAVNDELVKAGIEPHKFPSMAAAVRAAIGKIKTIRAISRKLSQAKRAISTLQDYHMLDKYIDELEMVVEEGESSEAKTDKEDRLYKTARALLDYYDQAGPDLFRSRFGFLNILEPCKQIIQEGEGNPHPWDIPSQEKDLADHG